MQSIAYISFDTVPAPKGAAIHISAFAQCLGRTWGNLDLVTVSPTSEILVTPERWPGVTHTQLPAVGKTLIDRILSFRSGLQSWLRGRFFDVIQIRSIFEGFPIAQEKSQYCQALIFEVNGLPSIELKYRYPNVADDRELHRKLWFQEQHCLTVADRIITPSSVTRDYLQNRGIPPDKIQVIPNGVDLSLFTERQPPSPLPTLARSFHLLYFGTLSAWQGITPALEALALLNREQPTTLTLISPNRDRQRQNLLKQAHKLGIEAQITLQDPMAQGELVQSLHQADLILAPLTPNDRNCLQGCCPLKVLEGMATGVPVLSSDLPVVQELGTHEEHFLLVRSGSAKAIKDAVLRLQAESDLGLRLGKAARQQVRENFTWEQGGHGLVAAYAALGINSRLS